MSGASAQIGERLPPQLGLPGFEATGWDDWPWQALMPDDDFDFARWLRAMLLSEPSFEAFLAGQAVSFIHVLRFIHRGSAHRSDALEGRAAALARDIMSAIPARLLERFVRPFGHDLPTIVAAMRPTGWKRDDYPRVAMLACDACARRILLGRREVTPGIVRLLAELPAPLRYAPFLLSRHAEHDGTLLVDNLDFLRTYAPGKLRAFAEAFAEFESIKDVVAWVDTAETTLPLPAAPWAGTPTLRPVSDRAELSRLAARSRLLSEFPVVHFLAGRACCYALAPTDEPSVELPVIAIDDGEGAWSFVPLSGDRQQTDDILILLQDALAGTVHRTG